MLLLIALCEIHMCAKSMFLIYLKDIFILYLLIYLIYLIILYN